jgi:hypothetical protein
MISFYIDTCHVCKKSNILCAIILAQNVNFCMCRSCINKKFDENLYLITEKCPSNNNKRPKLN